MSVSGGWELSRKLYLDFEFNHVVEPRVNLVCCATFDEAKGEKKLWWLHKNKKRQRELAAYLSDFDIIIGYSTVAESRSFLALGEDPLSYKWIDLFLEYRMMTNHNDRLQWGKQLVDGKVRNTRKPRPKWERTEEDKASGFKATHSLAEATYKLTGQIRDTEHKEKMRQLIISAPKEFSWAEQQAILKYCLDDVVFLPKIWKRLKEEFLVLAPDENIQNYFREAIERGRYSAHTAIMETYGYPIDYDKTKNFSKQVGTILFDIQREINGFFPDIKPFRWNAKENRYSHDQKGTKAWIAANHDTDKWMKTDGGDISLSLDAWERFYAFKHTYPDDNFGAQMVRFLKLKQSLYGFSDSKSGKTKSFWDSVGSDKRVRPYMNHYGAQSSRSQPGASGFMFLKPAWMRALVIPKPGDFMAGIDYGQQEFFVAGLESEDPAMIAAYLSGDPYLYGAKLAGAIPPDGTKETHGLIRNIFKNTYLGILFGMTKYGLAIKLTNDTGRYWSEDEAQEQIDIFEETFPIYMEWKEDLIEAYQDSGGIVLPCGWRMWGDNDNPRSVANVPIQGFGASIMRKAVDLVVERGVRVLFTLHDAIYIEGSMSTFAKDLLNLRKSMVEAFVFYFPEHLKEKAKQIKLDPFAWSPDFEKNSMRLVGKNWEVPVSNLYIDERAEADYKKFSQYFVGSDTDLL